ncbi:MAG TPA: methyltransferase [Rectinemataceae bacterium]|nr:methyltransferase [Rectinemataceae bacterium]
MSQHVFVFMLALELLAALGALVALLFVSAPYGKHSRPGWGPQMNSKWAWLLMETPAALVPAAFFLLAERRSAGTLFAFCLWELHYLYRSYVYSALQRGSRRSFPLLLAALAFVFNINNGSIIGADLFSRAGADLIDLRNFSCALGLALFLCGFCLHLVSDATIRALRRPGETDYRIPQGGAFRLVSNPNYLGEIVQWIGFALLTRSIAAWAFAFFTFCNVFPRAISNHRWYRSHFRDYPANRKIIFPFLF